VTAGPADLVDRMAAGKLDRRIAPGLLALAMLASAALSLYLARGTTFSNDELHWVVAAPDLTLRSALDPYVGHLVLVPKLVYKVILETIGSSYLTFRLLTLLALFVSVSLLFIWARRRVGDWLALAPCLVLLFFGSDGSHVLQGNGFTILTALACGVGALLALEKDSRAGDLLACLLLCLGAATYTVALPFMAGVAVLVLARTDRWRRIWIFLVPGLLYLAWRLWAENSGTNLIGGEVDLTNLLLWPAWSFQAIGAVTGALTGLGYDFSGPVEAPSAPAAGPALAVVFIGLLAWRYRRETPSPMFWALCAVALAMFALQAVGWVPEFRYPGSPRYLFPGAFVLLLVGFEAGRGLTPNGRALLAVGILTLAGIATNLMFLRTAGAEYRNRAPDISAQVTASILLHRAGNFPAGPKAKPLAGLVEPYATVITSIGEADDRYGGLGFDPGEITAQPESVRERIDSILVAAIDPFLAPVRGQLKGCSPDPVAAGTTQQLPPGGATLVSKQGGTIKIGRFADLIPATVGVLRPGRPAALRVPQDGQSTAWRITGTAPFQICDLPLK
jgi:hypothetical protein